MLDLKREKFRNYLNDIEIQSENFYEIREEIYELKREEIRKEIRDIKNDLEGEAILVFIGEYSSGKSTFINSLIGKELLPTANRPCTSTITEIRFVDDGIGHRGKIHKLDGGESEEISFKELLKLIDGGTSHITNFSSIHHVELIYDLTEDSEENDLLKAYAKSNIKIVDTPGYNSPYGLNENVVTEYIEKSKYSFWFFPADRIGGIFSKQLLMNIKRKGIEVIPIITKSDLLNSEEEKEDIRDSFFEDLSDLFRLKEPRFVSAYKIKEANDLMRKLKKNDDPSLKEKIEELKIESGMYGVSQDLAIISTNETMKEKRLSLAIDNTKPLIRTIIDQARKEKGYWKKELEDIGWVEENSTKKIDELTKQLKKWSFKEVKNISEGFANGISDKVINLIRNKKGKTSLQLELNKIIETSTYDFIEPGVEKIKVYVLEKYKSEADLGVSYKIDLEAPNLFNVKDIVQPILGLLEALKYQGPQGVISGGVGATLLMSKGVLAGVPAVGGALSAVGGIVGGGLIIFAILPLIPTIIDRNKERAKRAELEVKNTIRTWAREIKIESSLRRAIEEYIDELDLIMKGRMEDELHSKLSKYKKVTEISDELVKINSEFNIHFKG